MHAPVGLLGHDPEQQGLGQALALELRPHQVAHVLVVLVAVHQRRAHVGQPAADAGLDGRVELDHVVEGMPVVVAEQAQGAGHFRNRGGQRRIAFQQFVRPVVVLLLAALRAVHPVLEQALPAGQQVRHRTATLPGTGFQHVLHVLQRGIALLHAPGIAVAGQHQGVAVALLGGGHALDQGVGGGPVLGRYPLRQRRRWNAQKQDKNGQWPAALGECDGHRDFCDRIVRQGSRPHRRAASHAAS